MRTTPHDSEQLAMIHHCYDTSIVYCAVVSTTVTNQEPDFLGETNTRHDGYNDMHFSPRLALATLRDRDAPIFALSRRAVLLGTGACSPEAMNKC